MEIIINKGKTQKNEFPGKLEVLSSLEQKVKELIDLHISKRKLWFSSDFLPASEKNNDNQNNADLRKRVKGIKDPARVAVAVNLLTEEGLPHFHRIISKHLGDENFWSKWNNMWTAEEDRHGSILRDYARDGKLFNFREIELMQYFYLETGFNPDWGKDPYRIFVYTTLQERATQISHKNTGKLVQDDEPLLGNILSNIAADEARHFSFYRSVFKEILELDPNRAIESAAEIMPSIDMPGYSMPNFREMADVVRRIGIYGPVDYKKIVEEIIKFWNVELITGLNDAAEKAREKILAIPLRLEKVAQYLEEKTRSKTFSFDFIYNRILNFS